MDPLNSNCPVLYARRRRASAPCFHASIFERERELGEEKGDFYRQLNSLAWKIIVTLSRRLIESRRGILRAAPFGLSQYHQFNSNETSLKCSVNEEKREAETTNYRWKGEKANRHDTEGIQKSINPNIYILIN